MKYVYFTNTQMAAVTNLVTGEMTQFFSSDARFEKALELIKAGDYEAVEKMNVKVAVSAFVSKASFSASAGRGNVRIEIRDNVGYVVFSSYEVELAEVLVQRILKMVADGFDAQPLVNFISNLYDNPSRTAVQELFLFLDKAQLPITEDGHFIAYKIVRGDYLDIYSGTMDNSVGKVLAMPRNEVDDNRNNTCSRGLHFCSRDYLTHYGSGRAGEDRCMLVKINPADVVSIPSDYDNAKGRTWRYEVVGEVAAGWKTTLPKEDYTSKSVVTSQGVDIKPALAVSPVVAAAMKDDDLKAAIFNSPFEYRNPKRHFISGWFRHGASCGRKEVKESLGLTYSDLDNYERF